MSISTRFWRDIDDQTRADSYSPAGSESSVPRYLKVDLEDWRRVLNALTGTPDEELVEWVRLTLLIAEREQAVADDLWVQEPDQ